MSELRLGSIIGTGSCSEKDLNTHRWSGGGVRQSAKGVEYWKIIVLLGQQDCHSFIDGLGRFHA